MLGQLNLQKKLFFGMIAALFGVLPSRIHAQGEIIPRCGPAVNCAPGNPIVRTASDVRVRLENRVLHYEVTETFVNRGGGLGEADYIFPLPQGAAFENLALSINGELVTGETMNAADARRIYEEIVRRRRDPALVEWMGTGLLRARVFPIQAGEQKTMVVRFQTVAPREGSALRIEYVRGMPNQQPGPMPLPRPIIMRDDQSRGDSQGETTNTFTLTYPNTNDLGNPYSPTDELRVTDRGGQRSITAAGDGRDIAILLPLRHASDAAITVLASRPSTENGFALITITPPATPVRATPRDLTFVVDVSGSMRGPKLDQAKAAGRALLASLGSADRFRLIDFSTDVRNFRDEFVPATDDNKRAALRYLDNLVADGSTNISGALDAALDARTAAGRMPLVVFVTDGEPTVGERNPDAIAAIAARRRGDTRIFTVGISADVNPTLIEQLALEAKGTAQFVRAGESVEAPISLLATRLTSPVLTDIRVHADGVRLLQMQPSLPVDLFAGQDLVLLARYEGNGDARIAVDGQSANGAVHWSAPVHFPDHEIMNSFVPRLWASQRIGWLEAERRTHGATPELDAELKSLGDTYGIPTELSSYIVLEPGMDQNGIRKDATLRAQPMPAALPRDAAAGSAGVVVERRVLQFESAKRASEQRAATSLAQVDSVSANAGAAGATRQVGTHRFLFQAFGKDGNVWVDQRYTQSQRVVRVKAYSSLYFDLATRLNGMNEVLSLGDRIVVSGRNVSIEIAPDGLESMTPQDLADLVKNW